ncbi:Phosphoglycerol transferase MdoB [Paenibacillus algorifonticola]|uniref:Phosphoglycerol transferase MdoB n=1 Tax=Paenibacillus algorifonticola TaxID=684063 RepID=A0A1I2GAR9_9BACL|nr:LTA synthase family protein [Paenibacillus algorifonticola]SFF14288.1 Phosphoglycerol transferase MdoB [Paenibacillus algorifonticola]
MTLSAPKRLFSTRPIIAFSIIVLFKSYLTWMVVFGSPSWSTLFKEVPFALIVFCLIEWFATKRKLTYYLTANLLITAILFAVLMYYKYYGVIVTTSALKQVNQVTAVSNSVFSLMDPYYLLVFIDVILMFYFLMRKQKAQYWKTASQTSVSKRMLTSVFAVSLGLCLFNILPNSASMNEIVKAEQMGILNYEAYTIFGKKEPELVDSSTITQEKINSLKTLEPVASPQLQGAAKGKNLIIIQLESFQNFLIGLTIDGKEITPNMNKLAKENYYFKHFYQGVGQGNTSDAEFIVNTSYYIPPNGAATQVYAGKVLPSLPRILTENGYDTATFHTNVVEFWNRGELYQALGFNRYYDKAFFGEDDTVFFGASDEVLYKKTADELEKMDSKDQPFYAQVISMTAHHPFTIPDTKYKMELPERYEGTFVGDYIRAQNYADYVLGQFIDDLKQRGLWDDSLIVLYGDHLGLPIYSLDRDDKALMAEIYGYEYSYTDMINIPLVIASPGITSPKEFDQLGGQVDLLPTISNLLGVSLDKQIHFGQDLLNNTSYNLLPQRYYLPTGSFVSSKELFLSGSGYDDGTHHPLAGDGMESAKEATEDEYNRALELLQLSDSYVSQLPDREPQK